MTLNWTRGNGKSVLVLLKAYNDVTDVPGGGTYTANSVYGEGSQLGQWDYAVYIGTGTSVTVTGLVAGTKYCAAVIEYNFNPNVYMSPALTGNATTIKTALASNGITTVTNNSLAVNVNSGTASVSDINIINADSATGVLTATSSDTSAATLIGLTTTGTDLITVTMAAASTSAANLNAIDLLTGTSINATAITELTVKLLIVTLPKARVLASLSAVTV
jgi:hypothetical protein